MNKKISISIDNEQAVYIEVDGVQYSNSDEIPDQADRAKVEDLISRMSSEKIDAGFEDAEQEFDSVFEKDYQEFKKEADRGPILFVSIFLGIAALMLGIAIFSTVMTVRALAREQAVEGQVVRLVQHRSVDSQTGEVKLYAYPVVKFRLPDELPQEMELQEGSWPPAYKPGDPVTLLYDPDHLESARTKSFMSSLFMWFVPMITGIIGVVFFSVTLPFLRRLKLPATLREAIHRPVAFAED